jgi:hypothetical protein
MRATFLPWKHPGTASPTQPPQFRGPRVATSLPSSLLNKKQIKKDSFLILLIFDVIENVG